MGIEGEEGVCASSDFRVIGLENLRVADLSVCPVVPRYVVGL
jgi:choline dehydrogenase-like flavoprotein